MPPSLTAMPLPPEALGYADMGAGYDARMRVIDVGLRRRQQRTC